MSCEGQRDGENSWNFYILYTPVSIRTEFLLLSRTSAEDNLKIYNIADLMFAAELTLVCQLCIYIYFCEFLKSHRKILKLQANNKMLLISACNENV